jgi:hypothetical protein
MSMPVQADSELGYILSAAGRPAISLSTHEAVSQSIKQTLDTLKLMILLKLTMESSRLRMNP